MLLSLSTKRKQGPHPAIFYFPQFDPYKHFLPNMRIPGLEIVDKSRLEKLNARLDPIVSVEKLRTLRACPALFFRLLFSHTLYHIFFL